jgi:outer membrane protein OmpA-like peptidoglycan-associated protein
VTRRSVHHVAVLAAVTALAGTACGPADDDPGIRSVASNDVESSNTTIAAGGTDPVERTDSAGGQGQGGGTSLDRSQSTASSGLERRVSETLSELDAEVRDGNTVITLPESVLFDFDEYELLPEAAETLDRIAETIAFFEAAPVQVAGHTDSKGAPEYNRTLSEQRADAVVDYLLGTGAASNRITSVGFGETQPVAPNTNDDGSDNPEGRAQNRRVEIAIEGVDPADLSD